MKKTLLSVICLFAALSLSAQLQHKLVRYSDNYGMELGEFIYNQENRLIAVHELLTGEYECYDSISYDANGNLIKICGWQWLDDEFKFVNYIDYTYDSSNRLSTRTNYNLFGGSWELGGVYTYTYDEQGRHTHTELTMGGSVVQTIDYRYEGDLLQDETWYLYGEQSEKISYYYNEDGCLTESRDSAYEGTGYQIYGRHTYTYDSIGNRITHIGYDQTGSESERHIYTYSDMLKSETLMPYTPELSKPADTEGNVNVYTKEEYWTMDANFVLQHLCDYTYQYVGITESAVDNATIQQINNIRKVLIDGRIYIESGTELYDLNGRRVR